MSDYAPRLRPMGVGDLLDATIQVYRRQFLVFIEIGAVVLVPMGVLMLLLQLAGFNARSGTDFVALGVSWILSAILYSLAYGVMSLAMTYAVSEAYIGHQPTVGVAYRRAARRLGGLILLGIMAGLALVLLSITVIGIPFAIYFGIGWSVAVVALMAEGLGARRAMGRSRALVRGNWWRVFAFLILLMIIQSLVQWLFSTVGLAALAGVGFLSTAGAVISSVFNVAGEVLVGPITFCGLVLIYYDLRIRKEGFDLELLARDIGRTPGEGTAQ